MFALPCPVALSRCPVAHGLLVAALTAANQVYFSRIFKLKAACVDGKEMAPQ